MGSLPPIQLATLSMWDTLILMALALVVFGPRRLPKIGRQLGKLMYEFRKASNDFKFQLEEELRASEEADRRKKEEEERQRVLAAAPPPAQLEATASQTPLPAPGTEQAAAPVLAESPFSEGNDPNIEAKAQVVAEPAMPGTQPTEVASAAFPHIQPPSTGETVAAEPPAKTQGDLFPEAERSEPAAHHG
ncbi:MAG: twin-arginine translocase TatA/TatE family subunit [Terracidiphilus sp.]